MPAHKNAFKYNTFGSAPILTPYTMQKNEPLIRDFIESLDEKYRTQSKLSKKAPEDIVEKATRPSIKADKPWFDVEYIRDSLRFKTICDLNVMTRIAKELFDSPFEILKIDTVKLLNPKSRGWRMIAIDLRAPNGQLIEYQWLVPEMNKAGRQNHLLYKRWRDADPAELSQAELIKMNRDYYKASHLCKKAWQDYLKRTRQTEADVKSVIERLHEILTGENDEKR